MRITPTTTRVIYAIGDVIAMLRARLAAQGDLSPDDLALLRKIEQAQYWALKADIDRRKRHAQEDHGNVPSRLLREEREVEQLFSDYLQAA